MAVLDIQAEWGNGYFKPLSPLELDNGEYFMFIYPLKNIVPVSYGGGVLTPPSGTFNFATGTTHQICIATNGAQELENNVSSYG